MEGKSVLDGVLVEDKAFPLRKPVCKPSADLGVVGNCLACGAPVYGPVKVALGPGDIVVRHSCDCRSAKSLLDTMQTK